MANDERIIDPREPDIKGMREESYNTFLQDLEDARRLGVSVKEIRLSRRYVPSDDSWVEHCNEIGVW